jgi:pimeloyl-[acyl-carrier protein] methyl ester esterase
VPVFKTRDEAHLFYRDEGRQDGTAPVLVFLHGWAMDSSVFSAQFAELHDRFRLIALDFRGHGESAPIKDGEGIDVLADDVAALLAHLKIRRAVLVGWSMGAIVAWAMMERHGLVGVRAQVILDMTPCIQCSEIGMLGGHSPGQASRVAEKIRENWNRYAKSVIDRIYAEGRHDDGRLLEIAQRCDASSLAVLWGDLVARDHRRFLSALGLPALVIRGSKSKLYGPKTADWMANHMPDVRQLAVPDSGHAPHIEQPKIINTALEDFAAQIAA